ncbi:hypothetical protein D3C78_912140 [compost metagenome]
MSTIARLFLELAVGCCQHIFTRLDQAFGQGQLVFIGTTAVLFNQHRMLGIEHGHDHHRAITVTTPHKPFVGALVTIGKAQLHSFDPKQAAAGDNLAGEYGRFLAHGAAPGRERVTIPWLARPPLP